MSVSVYVTASVAAVGSVFVGVTLTLVRVSALLPRGTALPTLTAVDMFAGLFMVGFPALLALLAAPGTQFSSRFVLPGAGSRHPLIWLGQACCLLLVLTIVAAVPQWLRAHGRAMSEVAEPARTLLPSWLAAGGCVATWGYVFLLRFGDGALSRFDGPAVAAGGVAVAGLLAPVWQFVARSCWAYGLENVLDPVRWRHAVRQVVREVRAPSDHTVDTADVIGPATEEPYPA